MHHPGPFFHGHELRPHDPVSVLLLGHQGVEGLVLLAQKLLPAELPQDLRLLAQHLLKPRHGQDQPLAAEADLRVHRRRVDGQGHVGGEGPRGGGPDEDLHLRVLHQGHEDEDGGIRSGAVALGHLVRGEGGAAAGAVGEDLVAAVKEPLFVDPLYRPPEGLDVVVRHGDIGVLQIDPEPHPADHLLPLADVEPHRLLTFLHELLHPVGEDLRLAFYPQLLLHLDLHREPVAIPSRLPGDVIAPHGLVAGEEVLV